MHHTLPEERLSSHNFEQGSMEISFSKRDPIIGGFPIHVTEIERNNAIMSRDYLVPHAEEGGALAPRIGILATLQGSPQDLICGDQGTNHDPHVPFFRRCGTMQTQGEGREENQYHEMRCTHLYPPQGVDAPKKVIRLCNGSMESYFHSFI